MYVKRIIILTALFFSVSVVPVQAQAISPTLRANLIVQLQELLQQVVLLQTQLENLQSAAGSSTESQDKLYPTNFYDGTYESAYAVQNLSLDPLIRRTVYSGDKALFKTFIDLAGKSFVSKYISEFRIFNDSDSQLGAFVQQKTDGGWILAVNRFDENLLDNHDSQAFTELLLHEYAHIVFFEEERITADFKDKYWSSSVMLKQQNALGETTDIEQRLRLNKDFYEKYLDRFVSEYAASSPDEDITESFTAFVTGDKPTVARTADKKILFFYTYPSLQALRTQLRNSGVLRLE